MGTTKLIITGLVAVHLAVSIWHGNAHSRLGIELPAEKTLFVYVVILIAPLMAAALLWTRLRSIGLWLFFLSMLGSFLFGAYHHYLLVSPDNVGNLPPGSLEMHSQFKTSAGVIALLELVAALFGWYCLRRHRAISQSTV
jgi:hypothetical protein